jgi:Cu+-exporting ATPase
MMNAWWESSCWRIGSEQRRPRSFADWWEAVAAFASGLPFTSVHGGVSPSDKAARISDLKRAGRVVAFAGDGVNDAAALATADAGISLPGLDAAAASAPLNLHRHGLVPLLDARLLALKLRRNIHQNLAWAFGYNLILVPLAAFGLLDQFGGPLLAGAAMGMSSLTVVLNALRLRHV